jgi:hypothetical protein
MFIWDSRSEFFPSWVQGQKDPRSGSSSIKYFLPKKLFLSSWKLGNMIKDVAPGSGFFLISDLEAKKAPDHG